MDKCEAVNNWRVCWSISVPISKKKNYYAVFEISGSSIFKITLGEIRIQSSTMQLEHPATIRRTEYKYYNSLNVFYKHFTKHFGHYKL